ncbi:MAG: hypothetical protein GTO02_05785, partial [Candidatus Dadabacteria bacterium]|nr:hypothetical protein [Candidatus Dadabacteria bacterium]
MIIGPNFIIGHIPKTGGHALAVMMTKAGVKIKHPFKIVNNRAFATDEPKHKTIEQLRQENPDILNNRKLFLVMRRMPDWLFSVFWQFQVHTKLSAKGRLAKTGIGKTYEAGFKLKDPIIPPPELFCHSTYPDFVLKKHIPKLSFYRWLRIEHIKEDIKKELGIDLPDIGFQH